MCFTKLGCRLWRDGRGWCQEDRPGRMCGNLSRSGDQRSEMSPGERECKLSAGPNLLSPTFSGEYVSCAIAGNTAHYLTHHSSRLHVRAKEETKRPILCDATHWLAYCIRRSFQLVIMLGTS